LNWRPGKSRSWKWWNWKREFEEAQLKTLYDAV
jgi:hypothetical protein